MTVAHMNAHLQKCVQLFATPWISTVFRNLLRFKSTELVMLCYLTISSSAGPFSCLQSFPKSGSLQSFPKIHGSLHPVAKVLEL